MKILHALKEAVTGRDNQTHDLGRWSWLTCTIAILAHDAYLLQHGSAPNIKDLAIALSAIVVAHGVALGLKSSTEPGGTS
jgi:hypothetical protein